MRRALAKARAGAVRDPTFVSLPRPGPERRTLDAYHDPKLLELDDEDLVAAGWRIVTGALRTFTASTRLTELAESEDGLRRLRLLLGGDVTIVQERIAIASTHLPEAQTDAVNEARGRLELVVSAAGAYALNGQALANDRVETIIAALRQEARGDTNQPLVITADAKTPHELVVRAMDAAGRTGFAHLSITTRSPRATE